MSPFVDVVFDGPPSARSGRFVECEDEHGCGTKAGGWIDRGDGTWALRIQLPSGVPEAHNAVRDALSTLVRLYHGPRDANYRTSKDEAWDAAERALASAPAGSLAQQADEMQADTDAMLRMLTEAVALLRGRFPEGAGHHDRMVKGWLGAADALEEHTGELLDQAIAQRAVSGMVPEAAGAAGLLPTDGTVYGIRPHLPVTAEDDARMKRLAEQEWPQGPSEFRP